MYFLYSLLLTIGFLVLSPRFLFDALRHGKYVAGFRQRLGQIPAMAANGQPVIWLHCVSVGETQAARPLVESLRREFPNHRLVISTITATGQQLASEVFKTKADQVFYFPFDWGFTVERALKRINPSAVLLMETELWPGFLRKCHQHAIPVALVNGRISERSFRRYRSIKPFISRVLRSLNIAVMQAEEDAERLIDLGMSKDKVFVSGSLKFDAGVIPGTAKLTEELGARFDSPDRPLVLAASTHAPEERILMEAFRELSSKCETKPRLMIAPRHPERFNEVASMMSSSGFSWTRRSANSDLREPPDLILLDTIGELAAAYPLASVVFVGGSVVKRGGHNILEPAAVGSCIVTGAHTHNFASIVKDFVEAEAIIQLPPLDETQAAADLAYTFRELLCDPSRQHQLKQSAKALVAENLGATERTLNLIKPILLTPQTKQTIQVSPERVTSA